MTLVSSRRTSITVERQRKVAPKCSAAWARLCAASVASLTKPESGWKKPPISPVGSSQKCSSSTRQAGPSRAGRARGTAAGSRRRRRSRTGCRGSSMWPQLELAVEQLTVEHEQAGRDVRRHPGRVVGPEMPVPVVPAGGGLPRQHRLLQAVVVEPDHGRRGAGRAASWRRALVDNRDGPAGTRELEGDRAADDPGADDEGGRGGSGHARLLVGEGTTGRTCCRLASHQRSRARGAQGRQLKHGVPRPA